LAPARHLSTAQLIPYTSLLAVVHCQILARQGRKVVDLQGFSRSRILVQLPDQGKHVRM